MMVEAFLDYSPRWSNCLYKPLSPCSASGHWRADLLLFKGQVVEGDAPRIVI